MGKVQVSQEIFSSQLLGQRSVLRGSHSTGKNDAERLNEPFNSSDKLTSKENRRQHG